MRSPIAAVSSALVVLAIAAPALSQTGRYTMSPAEGGGFARLDSETGQMSLCQRKDGDWSCRDMADPNRGLNSEIDRLRSENLKLKAEISQMEDILLGKDKGAARPGGQAGTFKLPSEKEVDEAMDYAQRMLRKFRDRMKDLESELPGKGTPL